MKEIRLHARFGQPIGDLVKQIAAYALQKGSHVQAFNSFAAVRPGAPTFGLIRVAQEEILERSTPEADADLIIVLDNSLFAVGNVFKGLKPQGTVLALGMDEDILGERKDFKFKRLDGYFADNPADVGGNLINALKDLGVLT
ncbi:MAG: 2-oxoacid:acceptor oxidoreductase family protein [Desulfitobacteriia bacterium]|jgi:pyruvate ferredoxin oxidoreductase gamma subunit